MRQVRCFILLAWIFLFIGLFLDGQNIQAAWNGSFSSQETEITKAEGSNKHNNLVKQNGALKVKGTKLCNKKGKVVQLKGVSSHGIQWFGDYVNYDSLKYLRNQWGINVFRLAMYTEENGYLSSKSTIKSKIYKAIEQCIQLDMYVIVDWHILSDGNPQMHQKEAVQFFRALSKKYGKYPNIIYEICNEPNGQVSWKGNIKPYAKKVIKAIRANDKDSLIIVGTPTWSQDVDDVIASPLSYKNVMYALHFYAGTHGDTLRKKAEKAMKHKIPIFVSEWGTSDASGNGGPYLASSKKWVKWMNQYQLSWCSWSLCDKNEASALLKSGASKKGNWKSTWLSKSGKYIKSIIDTRK